MIHDDLSRDLHPYWRARHTVPGLLEDIDFLVFDWLLRDQEGRGTTGDLLEIGAFMRKSAIAIGAHAGPGDQGVGKVEFHQVSSSLTGWSGVLA